MRPNRILLSHGAGGKMTHELIDELFLEAFENEVLRALEDSALLTASGSRVAFTTDSYVVKPLFFPGGDIGRLSVCGTVNDLAMLGARPLGLSASFILEEGFPIEDLKRVIASMREAATEAGVRIVAGDTKVVEQGAAEGLYITTSGVGIVPDGVRIRGDGARPGDKVIVSGPIGDHEIAVLLARGDFSIAGEVRSDCAPLNGLVEEMLRTSLRIHALRDPTRGGLATVLWELAQASGVGIVIEEENIPMREEVKGVCELLGYDPYYLANEGKLVAILPEEEAPRVLEAMRSHPLGREAAVIGEVREEPKGRVLLKTRIGGHRLLEPLSGEQLPRIC